MGESREEEEKEKREYGSNWTRKILPSDLEFNLTISEFSYPKNHLLIFYILKLRLYLVTNIYHLT